MAKKKLSDSIAALENQLLDAEREGNKRRANCIKMILKRLKNKNGPNYESISNFKKN